MRVVLESPLGAPTREGIELNKSYARACMKQILLRGDAPYASHLLYDHSEILDDQVPAERELGMTAGFEWSGQAEKCCVYVDRGISGGMRRGIEQWRAKGMPIEYWSLEDGFLGSLPPDAHVS